MDYNGGEDGIRTHARITPTKGLANLPLQPLGYLPNLIIFYLPTYLLYQIFLAYAIIFIMESASGFAPPMYNKSVAETWLRCLPTHPLIKKEHKLE